MLHSYAMQHKLNMPEFGLPTTHYPIKDLLRMQGMYRTGSHNHAKSILNTVISQDSGDLNPRQYAVWALVMGQFYNYILFTFGIIT